MFKDLKYQLDRAFNGQDILSKVKENNILEEGLYITIRKDKEGKYFFDIDSIYMADGKKIDCNSDKYTYYSELDLYSKYLSSNKAVGDKNISSCNYLSLFIKKQNFDRLKELNCEDESIGEEERILAKEDKIKFEEAISNYYDSFKEYNTKDKNKHKIYKEFEKKYNYVSSPDEIETIKTWILNNILELSDYTESLKKGSYIKLYIDKDIECYKKEYLRYSLPSLFLDNEYNQVNNSITYGVPIPNISLNKKKPYKLNKTRCCENPYLTDSSNNEDIYNTFMYLKTQVGNPFLHLGDDGVTAKINKDQINGPGVYIKMVKGTELVNILDYDITTTSPKYKSYLVNRYIVHSEDKNSYGIEYYTGDDKAHNVDNVTNNRRRLSELISDTFFENKLSRLYFADDSMINDILGHHINSSTKICIKKYKDIMFNCLIKGSLDCFDETFDKMSMDFIRHSYDNRSLVAIKQFNVRMSILENLKGVKYMKSSERAELLYEKIKNHGFIENDEEFSYAIGQIMYYMFATCNLRNNHYKKSLSKSANADRLVEIITNFRKKYDFKLDKNARFNVLLKLILDYKVQEPREINEEYFMLGYVSSNENIMFIKDENNKDLSQEEK